MKAVRQEIEIILARQWASYLSTPVFLVDIEGTLLFYNEPAETILGHRFEDTGEMPVGEWTTVFLPTDENGAPIPAEGLPLVIAITQGRPAHRDFWIQGLDGKRRHLEVTAFPLITKDGRALGGAAIFWGQTTG